MYISGVKEGESIIEGIRAHSRMDPTDKIEYHLISADLDEASKNMAIEHRPNPIPRRVIMTTHILPAPDVAIVIDPMTQRTRVYDPEQDCDIVTSTPISAGKAQQRMSQALHVSRCISEADWVTLVRDRPECTPKVAKESYHEALLHNMALMCKVQKKSGVLTGEKTFLTASKSSSGLSFVR